MSAFEFEGNERTGVFEIRRSSDGKVIDTSQSAVLAEQKTSLLNAKHSERVMKHAAMAGRREARKDERRRKKAGR